MAVNKPNKKIRQVDGRAIEDAASIANLTYNEAGGAQKNLQVGPFLKPLNNGSGGFTTNATAALSIRKGTSIAVYNNSGTAQAISFGDSSAMAALAAGVTDVNGNVGMACKPNDWSYFNSDEKSWIRADSGSLIVYLIKDESYISSQG
jgi:hypothetical protein